MTQHMPNPKRIVENNNDNNVGYRLVSWDPIVRNFPKIIWYPVKGGWASIVRIVFLRSIFSRKHKALYPPFFDESW